MRNSKENMKFFIFTTETRGTQRKDLLFVPLRRDKQKVSHPFGVFLVENHKELLRIGTSRFSIKTYPSVTSVPRTSPSLRTSGW